MEEGRYHSDEIKEQFFIKIIGSESRCYILVHEVNDYFGYRMSNQTNGFSSV